METWIEHICDVCGSSPDQGKSTTHLISDNTLKKKKRLVAIVVIATAIVHCNFKISNISCCFKFCLLNMMSLELRIMQEVLIFDEIFIFRIA